MSSMVEEVMAAGRKFGLPQSTVEAEYMEKMGFAYLREHDPDRLTPEGLARPLTTSYVDASWPTGARFKRGDRVRKHSGAWWEGTVVGFYCTDETPIGYNIQLDRVPRGPVQIYPETALELV